MSKDSKPNMLSSFFKFFNWEVSCECCGSRFDGDGTGKDQTKEIVAMARFNQQNSLKQDKEEKVSQEQVHKIEKLSENLFDQMETPNIEILKIETNSLTVKSSISKRKSKQGDIPTGQDGKPKWTQEKDAQLRQYINQYGPNAEIAKEFFPSFEIKELMKRIKKIMQNKDDSIKAKIRNLIKKGTKLNDIMKILNEVPATKVKKFHDKIVFNTQKKREALDPKLLERVLGNCNSENTKSTTASFVDKDVAYDEIALDDEEVFDGYFYEDEMKTNTYDEFDFATENMLNGVDDPFVFGNYPEFKKEISSQGELFDLGNSEMGNCFNDAQSLNSRKMSDLAGGMFEENPNGYIDGDFDRMDGYYNQINRYE